jgi:murein DD-endopeptidase MepM/ murein hydrolase activator NlpD
MSDAAAHTKTHEVAETPELRRRISRPTGPTEAEPTDRQDGRSSASSFAGPVAAASGFDSLFAGLGDADEPAAEASGRSASHAEQPRTRRTERKAEKPAKPSKSSKPAARRSADRAAGASARGEHPRPSVSEPRVVRVRSLGRPATRPATRSTPVVAPRRRGFRAVSSLVAMSFAALLAVATTIPSLSLLTAADVQALAYSDAAGVRLDGQRVTLDGNIVAQSMQREGFETQTLEESALAAGIRADTDFINNPAGTIQWPFKVGVHVGDRFGYRNCAGCSSDHGGQDFNPGLGAEIQTIADGVVSNSTDSGGSLGVVVMVDHVINGETVTSVYAHMEYDSRRFQVGDVVEVGDVLGTTGSTGMSTGPHLHFEIRIGGINGTKVDPLEWLWANTN